jgi:FkbM family methyltransferase
MLNDKIRKSYLGIANVFIENIAITEKTKGLVKLCIPKNGVAGDYSLLPMDDWGDEFITLEVSSRSFNDLCKKYEITNVHYLQIDTEGYDSEIIQAINFNKISIDIIKHENWKFTEDCFKRYGNKAKQYGLNGMKLVQNLLIKLGYMLFDQGNDTLAIKQKDG